MKVRIGTSGFKGVMPGVDPVLLPENAATVAVNCDFRSGAVQPWRNSDVVSATLKSGIGSASVVKAPGLADDQTIVFEKASGYSGTITLGGTKETGDQYTVILDGVSFQYTTLAEDADLAAVATKIKGLIDAHANFTATVAGPVITVTFLEVRSLYFYRNSHWLSFTQDTDFAVSPVPGDAFGRLYYTEAAGPPKMLVNDEAFLSEPAPSGNPYTLGIPAPAAAPTLGEPSGGDAAFPEARGYVCTYVSAHGEEGPPSPASAIGNVNQGGSQPVGLPGAPEGSFNIVAINLYRTNTGSTTTEYLFVPFPVYGLNGSIPIEVMNVNDNVAASELSEVLPSASWMGPRADMIGICAGPNGNVAGFSGNRACFCEPWFPHAWPREYEYAVAGTIIGGGWVGSSFLVLTDNVPVLLTGTPGAMSDEKLDKGYACVSKRGVVDVGGAIIYPAQVGLVAVAVSGAQVLTQGLFTKAEWEALNPSSITGFQYGDSYVGFYDNGTTARGFIISADGNFSYLDFHAEAGHYDHVNGRLYLVIDGQLHLFDGGATRLTFTWRSRPFLFQSVKNFSCGMIRADAFPVTLNVYADNVLKHSQTVQNDAPFRLPGGFASRRYQFEVIAAGRVSVVEMAESITELMAD